MKNEVVAAFGSCGCGGRVRGVGGQDRELGRVEERRLVDGGTPARVSRSWIVIATAAWRMSAFRRESGPLSLE